jgi:hypothetical protein
VGWLTTATSAPEPPGTRAGLLTCRVADELDGVVDAAAGELEAPVDATGVKAAVAVAAGAAAPPDPRAAITIPIASGIAGISTASATRSPRRGRVRRPPSCSAGIHLK